MLPSRTLYKSVAMSRLTPLAFAITALLLLAVAGCSTRTPVAEDPSPPAAESRAPEPATRDQAAGTSVPGERVESSTAIATSDDAVGDEPAPDEADVAEEGEGDGAEDGEEGGEADSSEALANIRPENATEQAPAEYDVVLDTTKGNIRIHVVRAWAPNGADRFYNLVKLGYFNDTAFFRVIEGFMAQVGMHGVPGVNARWQEAQIPDDAVAQSNTPGMVTFAARGQPNSRTTQFFINMGNNANLDQMRFAPFGRTRDMDVVRALYSGYGEGAPRGRGPSQGRIAAEGNAYLRRDFPNLDYIRTASLAP